MVFGNVTRDFELDRVNSIYLQSASGAVKDSCQGICFVIISRTVYLVVLHLVYSTRVSGAIITSLLFCNLRPFFKIFPFTKKIRGCWQTIIGGGDNKSAKILTDLLVNKFGWCPIIAIWSWSTDFWLEDYQRVPRRQLDIAFSYPSH